MKLPIDFIEQHEESIQTQRANKLYDVDGKIYKQKSKEKESEDSSENDKPDIDQGSGLGNSSDKTSETQQEDQNPEERKGSNSGPNQKHSIIDQEHVEENKEGEIKPKIFGVGNKGGENKLQDGQQNIQPNPFREKFLAKAQGISQKPQTEKSGLNVIDIQPSIIQKQNDPIQKTVSRGRGKASNQGRAFFSSKQNQSQAKD
ncbi:UNKNOWN [Stylonychia lemnae]|uniref:Uncharacterized protein n=1 Tax=Stylonychia lemnae TaxID=5949 RepID=A0A078B489_STYLE|nr:UNKNOWN [Stylonychia lemnae]|eukprot:CDW89066.1 UNKNOWN [Stylonychia lemnae]